MSDRYAYRASDELAAAFREFQARHNAQLAKLATYNLEHPGHPVLVGRSGIDQDMVLVFKDVDPSKPPLDGLSRAQTRDYLMPKRGAAGQRWRDELAALNAFPKMSELLRKFGIQDCVLGMGALFVAGVQDYGEHGVFVTIGTPYEPVPPSLAAVPLSEFYRAQEAADALEASGA